MNKLITSLLVLTLMVGCTKKESDIIKIETSLGIIKIKLYDKTPKHKENFKKLVKEGFYDDVLFHRVIDKFMVQGGDPESVNAKEGARLGNGGPGYKVDAEFVPEYIHKKGVLAAAREGDNVNPNKMSSGSQFYIVEGTTYTEQSLNTFIERKNLKLQEEKIYKQLVDTTEYLKSNNIEFDYNEMVKLVSSKVPYVKEFDYTQEQKEAYYTLGGTPHLDGSYTVFGEIIEGLDILELISAVETDKNDRPLEDIKMKMSFD